MTETLTEVELEKEAAKQVFTSNQEAKLVIRTDVLKTAVKRLAGSISTKTTIPILSGIYIHANNERVIMRAANNGFYSELIISDIESFMIEGNEASIVFPGKQFSDIVNKMSGKNITIEFNGLWTKFTSKGAKPTLAGYHADEYPIFPVVDPTATFSIPSGSLLDIYNKTLYALSSSETRPILTGINHEVIDKEFRCVATDSHRLSRMYHPLEVNIDDVNMTIPGDSIKEVMKHLRECEMVEISFDQTHIIYKMDDFTLYSRVLESTYPLTDRLIPKETTSSAQFIVGDLRALFERINLYVNKTTKNGAVATMVIRPEDKQMRVTSLKTEIGQGQEDVMIQKASGLNLVITASVGFVLDALKTFDADEEIEFIFMSATSPFILRSPNSDTRNIQLVLPVRTYGEVTEEIKDFNPGEIEEDPLKDRANKYAEQAIQSVA